MPFKYACFISYRHGQRELLQQIVTNLRTAISGEFEAWFGPNSVILDEGRLRGGDFYNEALALALCESVCMIVVYVPAYFDTSHTFCAREYKAMEQLEGERLGLLRAQADKQHGLIIPIVFRGKTFLPKEIADRRHYYDFESFQLTGVDVNTDTEYKKMIKEIAEYIAECCKRFANLDQNQDPCASCEKFSLPTEEEIRPWLKGVAGPASLFPNR